MERKNKPLNPNKDTLPSEVTKKTFTDEELKAYKNKFLRIYELHHYNHLKQLYENKIHQEKLKKLKQMYFEHSIFQRAKELYKMKMKQGEKQTEEIAQLQEQNLDTTLITRQITVQKELSKDDNKKEKSPTRKVRGKKIKYVYIEE